MKFNKYNPAHYITYFLSLISLFLATLLYLFNKKKNNVIVFTGHKLIGNIEILINSESLIFQMTLMIELFSFGTIEMLEENRVGHYCTGLKSFWMKLGMINPD